MEKILIYSKKIVAVLILIFILSACSDWLGIQPENDLINEKFWVKTADVNSSVAASYNAFRDCAKESFIWGELRGDIVKIGGVAQGYLEIAQNKMVLSNPQIDWGNYYKAINLANTVMYYDEQVMKKDKSFTQSMKNAVDAEMLFLRSMSFFYLVRVWKEAPLAVNAVISDTCNLFLPKSPEHVIVKQIITDLLKAKDLAYTTEYSNDLAMFKGRANKYSILALLADVYLWNEQYDKCIEACDEITNSGLFGLETTANWFNLYFPGNDKVESIFEIQFNSKFEGESNSMVYGNDVLQNSSFNANVIPQFFNNKEDLRTFDGFPNFAIWKYIGLSGDKSVTTFRADNQADPHIIYYRYADVMLMKAESLIELNRLSEASALISEISLRAGNNVTLPVDQNGLRIALLDERAREFVYEGKRWFDLLRYAKRNHFANKQYLIDILLNNTSDVRIKAVLKTKVTDTMSYYLPVPLYDLKFNKNLVQNPYYDR